MFSLQVAPPQNLQLQSPLVQLPAEVKHIIFDFCFAAGAPIVNPLIGCDPSKNAKPSLFSLALLLTCRRVYHDADHRAIFSQNIFRFTSVDRIRCFFTAIGAKYSACVQDVEIDARELHYIRPGVSREWLQYLAWGGGSWGKLLGSLRADAPKLKCLRINFESWPLIPMFRAELWNLLRNMLLKVEDMERVMVVGASKGAGMAMRDPWSPVHFVGGDDVGSDDLVERMWSTVNAPEDAKVIRWTRGDGKLYLEVVTKAYLVRNVDNTWIEPHTRKRCTDSWPADGTCTWFAYQHRHSDVVEPTTKGLNPSAAG